MSGGQRFHSSVSADVSRPSCQSFHPTLPPSQLDDDTDLGRRWAPPFGCDFSRFNAPNSIDARIELEIVVLLCAPLGQWARARTWRAMGVARAERALGSFATCCVAPPATLSKQNHRRGPRPRPSRKLAGQAAAKWQSARLVGRGARWQNWREFWLRRPLGGSNKTLSCCHLSSAPLRSARRVAANSPRLRALEASLCNAGAIMKL